MVSGEAVKRPNAEYAEKKLNIEDWKEKNLATESTEDKYQYSNNK